jgi:HAD superfamily hydrolase (TIGR01509 family)
LLLRSKRHAKFLPNASKKFGKRFKAIDISATKAHIFTMLQAVIFDFDGVIVDSEPWHHKAFNTVLEADHIQIEWDLYQELYIGFDDRDALKTAFKKAHKHLSSKKLAERISQKATLFEHYATSGEISPLPGAIQLIKSIPIRLPVGLCSGALRSDIEPIITAHRIKENFRTIVSAEDTKKSKPHPAPYQLALENLKISEPANAVAIEDTPAGIRSAKTAGMKVLAVTTSFAAEHLTEADAIANSLENVNRKTLEDMIL